MVLPIHIRQTREEMAKKRPLVIKHYELLFRGRIHLKRKGEHGLQPLKQKTQDRKTQDSREEPAAHEN